MPLEPFAIVVTITLKPGTRDELMPVFLDNASSAVRDEPACQQFQVMIDDTDPDIVVFYEVYDNAAALDFHRLQPHFLRYADATEDLILEKSIRSCTLLKA